MCKYVGVHPHIILCKQLTEADVTAQQSGLWPSSEISPPHGGVRPAPSTRTGPWRPVGLRGCSAVVVASCAGGRRQAVTATCCSAADPPLCRLLWPLPLQPLQAAPPQGQRPADGPG